MNKAKLTIIYILGSGHSGSTLLDLLLGTHPQIWSCGELQQLPRYINSDTLTCSCDAKISHCSFWSKVISCLEDKGLNPRAMNLNTPSWRSLARLPQREREKLKVHYKSINKILFECISMVSGRSFIVDSSKQAQRLYLMMDSSDVEFKVVHLVRDGRAVVNSFVRKYGRSYLWKAIYRWMSPNVVALWLRRRFPQDRWMQVHYEQLAQFPEETLKAICRFLDVPYAPEMLRFAERVAHNIDGNLKVLRYKSTEIRLDDRWKRELHLRDRWVFELTAGWLNAYYASQLKSRVK